MRNAPSLVAGALLLCCAGASLAAPRDYEADIAKTLSGRTAGPPVDCIRQIDIQSTEIIPRTAVIYKMRNGDYYLNRPQSGANFLGYNDILATDTRSDQLCGVDIVRLIDNTSHFPNGTLGLGKFVPYKRADKQSR